jgi:NitT/TauT family transport system substrate-binding protein
MTFRFRLVSVLATIAMLGVSVPQTAPMTFSFWAAGQGGMFGQVVRDKQFFEAQGLNVQYLAFPTIDGSIRAVQTGASNIGTQNPLSIGQMALQGTDLVILAANLRAHAYLLVPKNSPIKSPADFKGKKIGTSGPGTATDALITAILQYGYHDDPSSFTKIAAQEAQLISFLDKDQIDVAVMRNITYDHLENKSDYRIVGTLANEWQKYTGAKAPAWTAVVFVTRDYLNANRAAVTQAMVAMIRANEYAMKDTPGVAAILGKDANLPPDAAMALAQTWAASTTIVLDPATISSLQHELNAFVQTGLLTKSPDLTKIIDAGPYRDAMKIVQQHP